MHDVIGHWPNTSPQQLLSRLATIQKQLRFAPNLAAVIKHTVSTLFAVQVAYRPIHLLQAIVGITQKSLSNYAHHLQATTSNNAFEAKR